MGQNQSFQNECYEPIEKRHNVMDINTFNHNHKANQYLVSRYKEQAKMLRMFIDKAAGKVNDKNSFIDVCKKNFEEEAFKMKQIKNELTKHIKNEEITIFPDVNKTPNNNKYKNNVLHYENYKKMNYKNKYNEQFRGGLNFPFSQMDSTARTREQMTNKNNKRVRFDEFGNPIDESTQYEDQKQPKYNPNQSLAGVEKRGCGCPFAKEGFISSGSEGARFNKDTGTIIGPALFTNQMLQNGSTWNDVKKIVQEKGYASDGSNIIGAGPGNQFDRAMGAHIRNVEIMAAANNEYNTPEMLKEINKNINQDIAAGTSTSMYNRANQTKGKIISLNDRAVGVLPEEFYPERCKNRNIYKTNEIIPIAGFNINEARIGENLSEIHPVLYLQRKHRRMATGAGTDANLKDYVGDIAVPQFDARIGRTGNDRVSGPSAMDRTQQYNKEGFTAYDRGAMTGDNNFKGAFRASEGGSYWMPKRFSY